MQEVGFRPYIYTLAQRHSLTGPVSNVAEGIHIEAEGSPKELESFLQGDKEGVSAPGRGGVGGLRPLAVLSERVFRIEESREAGRRQALVFPDAATCEDSLAELFDPSERRYRYPFINCTNCGPRFTITRSIPYDRGTTTMSGFEMCPECQREYDDPSDRRFHG